MWKDRRSFSIFFFLHNTIHFRIFYTNAHWCIQAWNFIKNYYYIFKELLICTTVWYVKSNDTRQKTHNPHFNWTALIIEITYRQSLSYLHNQICLIKQGHTYALIRLTSLVSTKMFVFNGVVTVISIKPSFT